MVVRLFHDMPDKGDFVAEKKELYGNACYKRIDKENLCAVCSSTKMLAKFYVVPHLYRNSFEHDIKSATSADIVLLCQRCHDRSLKH